MLLTLTPVALILWMLVSAAAGVIATLKVQKFFKTKFK